MTKAELQSRNKKFALEVIRLMRKMPSDRVFDGLVRQVVRSSTSVGANYRAACRGKSTADFINKLKIVEEEGDETIYFLDLMKEIDNEKNKEAFDQIIKEGNELVSIYVASIKTMRQNVKS
jgi:four helix bundle protein